jgi:uncharacterized membrane protein (DUF4010 family)
MLPPNAVLLTLISPAAAVPMVLMNTATFLVALLRRGEDRPSPQQSSAAVAAQLRSPFSLQAAMKFGLIFLALQVVGPGTLIIAAALGGGVQRRVTRPAL